ncbi:hypothetical protein MMC30_004927 [Trapelia coarctata]|nr:hypothetical protein [Trapelia coarctata]
MQRRIDRRFTPPTQQPQTTTAAKSSQTPAPVPVVPLDEKAELEQVNVFYSFLENRYTKKYPLSQHIMKPLSNPEYYDTLLHELQEAPNRSWFGAMINKWKGYIRFT